MSGLGGALVIGIAFGWFLERGGLGDARKLAGQFYLRDLTVFKVLFTALLTAALGLFWLGRVGLVDPATLPVPPTAPLAQTVGGLVFGVGFVVAGLCPGTSCVAAASGRLDGVAAVGGMLLGVFAFGELFPWLGTLYGVGSPSSLPEVWGWSEGAVLLGLTGVALAGFAGAEWWESRRRA